MAELPYIIVFTYLFVEHSALARVTVPTENTPKPHDEV